MLDLHDLFLATATVLPVLYIPLTLLILQEQRGPQSNKRRAFVLVAATVVLVNAEIIALLALIGDASRHVRPSDWTYFGGLVCVEAVVGGIGLSLGVFLDLMLGEGGAALRSRLALALLLGMGLPLVLVVRAFHVPPWEGVLIVGVGVAAIAVGVGLGVRRPERSG